MPSVKKPYRPKYAEEENAQTPEQKLVQALYSAGGDSGDLLSLLGAMRSESNLEKRQAMFNDQAYSGPSGRAYIGSMDKAYYQPQNEQGEYIGTGRLATAGDVQAITGGRAPMSKSELSKVSRMLHDPAIMQFFMDIYGKAGKARKPNVTTLKTPKSSSECEIELGSGVPLSDACDKFARNMGKD